MTSVAARTTSESPSSSETAGATSGSLTVAIVGICSAQHLARCLDALARQEGAPSFEIVVAFDPHVTGVLALRERYPHVRIISNEGQRTPLELASRVLHESRGDRILLTEDHCVPRPDWVARLCAAHADDRGAVGGVIEIGERASVVDWAFYFVDFFRYASPARAGPSPTVSVCNVSYQREMLSAIAPLWEKSFHETAINEALRRRFGALWLEPSAVVAMSRHVTLGDALYERYAFGRLFGCTRLEFTTPAKRVYYSLFAPALPLILMGRMGLKAMGSVRLARSFFRAFVPLALMVLWWSWGEWLGYLTRRHPRSLVVAPEIRAAKREQNGATEG